MDANDHFEFIGGDYYTLAFLRETIEQSQSIQLVLLGPQLPLDKTYLQIGMDKMMEKLSLLKISQKVVY